MLDTSQQIKLDYEFSLFHKLFFHEGIRWKDIEFVADGSNDHNELIITQLKDSYANRQTKQ